MSAHVTPSVTTTALLYVRRGEGDSGNDTSQYSRRFSWIWGSPKAKLKDMKIQAPIATIKTITESRFVHKHL